MKTETSKSEQIREYLKSLPPSKRSPKAVSDALNAKGVKVSPGHVSLIKAKIKVKRAKAKKTTATKPSRNGIGEELLKAIGQAKTLMDLSGGLDKAKKFLDLVDQIRS